MLSTTINNNLLRLNEYHHETLKNLKLLVGMSLGRVLCGQTGRCLLPVAFVPAIPLPGSGHSPKLHTCTNVFVQRKAEIQSAKESKDAKAERQIFKLETLKLKLKISYSSIIIHVQLCKQDEYK